MDDIELEVRDGIGVVQLNRPDRLNAYSPQTVSEFLGLCDRLERDLSIRVAILHGAGRAFCAGLDMKTGIGDWDEGVGRVQNRYRVQQRLASMVVRLREIPQPVIAAVHGHAVGGGLALAAAADLRVADGTARFSAAFVRLGLSGGDDGSTWFLPRLLGPAVAADLLYTGRTVDADEALRIGLVNRVVEDGRHLEASIELAQRIMANPPFGVRMTKELLNFSLGAPSLRDAIELENRTQALCLMTDDFAEGERAYAERRPARFADR